MSELRDLYQEVILDHGKRPRNFRELEPPHRRADGHNPLCGDRITVYVVIEGATIRSVTFQGSGCAISMAAASMMTQALEGKSIDEAQTIFDEFHSVVTGKLEPEAASELNKLVVFAGVRQFPVRIKCATLPWHTLRSALANKPDPVSTE